MKWNIYYFLIFKLNNIFHSNIVYLKKNENYLMFNNIHD